MYYYKVILKQLKMFALAHGLFNVTVMNYFSDKLNFLYVSIIFIFVFRKNSLLQ